MAEEIKEDDSVEEEPVEETEGNPSPDNEEEEEKEEKNKKTGKSKPAKPVKKSGKIKWIFLIFILLLAGAAGAAYYLFPDKFTFLPINNNQAENITVDEDNLVEETLAPFFIPPGPSSSPIRIDIMAVWDNLASIRYKKKELKTRNMIYNKLYKMAGEARDLNNDIPAVENEVSLLLSNALGVQNLEIKIKEIRYF